VIETTRHARFDPHTFTIINFIYANVDLVCVRSKITDLLDMLCSSLFSHFHLIFGTFLTMNLK